MALPLAGALVLFGLVGCSSDRDAEPDFSAPGIAGADLVVAEVDGHPVTAGEVYQKIRLQYPQMPQSGPGLGMQAKELVKAVIDERCMAGYGAARGLDQDPDYQRTLEFSRRYILGQTVRNAMDAETAPSEQELRAYYDGHQSQFTVPGQVWYHQILLSSDEAAQRAIRRLSAGEDFEAVAREISRDETSASRGGRMPPFRGDGTQSLPKRYPELATALAGLEEGQIGAPVHTELGWHVLRVDARRAEYVHPFEEMHDTIKQKLIGSRGMERLAAVMDSLKRAYRVRIYEDKLDEFYYLQMDAEQLFQTARGLAYPRKRIEMYQQIVDRFPQSDRRAEAEFMIGYEYAENLGEPELARQAFERFLRQHPDHPLAASARQMLATGTSSPQPSGKEAPAGDEPEAGGD